MGRTASAWGLTRGVATLAAGRALPFTGLTAEAKPIRGPSTSHWHSWCNLQLGIATATVDMAWSCSLDSQQSQRGDEGQLPVTGV